MSNKAKTQMDINWQNRKLCRDESCIGVIGPDGRCKECGMVFSPQEKKNSSVSSMDAQPDNVDAASQTVMDLTENTILETTESEAPEMATDGNWENRLLCIDESCIGVIGPDGKCKECGTPYRET